MAVKFEINTFAESGRKNKTSSRHDNVDKNVIISGLTASEFWAHQRANRLQRT